jgi:UDP-3-O-[3-hydroxymyristoyl] N-acetylglucosamine deacetylase/3-hydroxyacyl-[acyl-carrier-protein] dehydratase
VQTVEHLLSALRGVGVDNARIEIDAGEPPALDGSGQGFVTPILEAGLVEQDADRAHYQVLFPVVFQEGDATITAIPDTAFRVTSTIHYPGTLIGSQTRSLVITPESYQQELMACRTFCLGQEIEAMQAAGLALGGSLENAVVVDGQEVRNESLRFPDEFVRHKILDLIGDLSLAGAPIRGHFVAHKSGHVHNVKLLKKLFEEGALGVVGTRPAAPLDLRAIRRILPHRFPMLLVDRIEELEVGVRAVGTKGVTYNEPFFQGHFPGRPVMPGVLIMEALAQVAGVVMLSKPEFQGKTPLFTGLDKVRFRKPIRPGDTIRLEVAIEKIKLSMGRAIGRALVDGQEAASGLLKFTLID